MTQTMTEPYTPEIGDTVLVDDIAVVVTGYSPRHQHDCGELFCRRYDIEPVSADDTPNWWAWACQMVSERVTADTTDFPYVGAEMRFTLPGTSTVITVQRTRFTFTVAARTGSAPVTTPVAYATEQAARDAARALVKALWAELTTAPAVEPAPVTPAVRPIVGYTHLRLTLRQALALYSASNERRPVRLPLRQRQSLRARAFLDADWCVTGFGLARAEERLS